MRLHRLVVAVGTVVVAVVLALGESLLVWAAPQHPAPLSARMLPATTLTGKVTLPETSIDGPALSSVVGTFEGVSFNKSVIAWTGTDAAHHLNVETSTDGLHFDSRTKLTLDETSPFRPDVTQIGQPAGGNITVAWTGSDPNHLLNVLWDVYGSHPIKLTLPHDNSFTAPAILQQGSTLFLAWTGIDANHSLNILPITVTGTSLVPGQKTTLSQFSSNAGPHLSNHGTSAGVQLNWTTRALVPNTALSAQGLQFPTVAQLTSETSAFAPEFISFTSEGGPEDWIGWTGTDAAHHLNLQWTTHYPQFPDPANTKTTLSDAALGGPALAFNAGPQIAWTGTNLDTAHHLNIAKFAFS